jgi:hypothetical protein
MLRRSFYPKKHSENKHIPDTMRIVLAKFDAQGPRIPLFSVLLRDTL